MNRRTSIIILSAAVVLAASVTGAQANSTWSNAFGAAYPAADGSRIDTCALCHTAAPALNPYGASYAIFGHSFTAVAAGDADGDGFSNAVEIAALSFPGDSTDRPAPSGPDTTAPTVTGFSIPAAATTLSVPILALTASDNVGVVAFLVNESATQPALDDPNWAAEAPTAYTFAAYGAHTLYAYAMDGEGNVSNGLAASVTVTLGAPPPPPPPPADTTAPTVASFNLPATADTLTVPITGIAATDDVGVTAFLVSESGAQPAAGAPGWTAAAPASFTFPADGAHTLYAYARDLAGNVSAGRAASVTITIAAPPPPPPPPLPPTPPSAAEALFVDTFDDATASGDADWQTVTGAFGGRRGAFASLGHSGNLALVQNVPGLDPFLGGTIETGIQIVNSSTVTQAGVVFDYQDEQNYRYVVLSRNHLTLTVGEVAAGGHGSKVSARQRTRPIKLRKTPKDWHHLRVVVDSAAGLVSVYLDHAAAPAMTQPFEHLGEGRVGITAVKARAKAFFDNFQVEGASAQP